MYRDRRRSIISLVVSFAVVEVGAFAAYMALASLEYYAAIYRSLGLARYVPFSVAHAAFILGAQTVLVAVLFWRWYRQYGNPEPDIQRLITAGEHENLERKSTLRWDLAAGKVNKVLERAAMKTVAAFLNTGGGHLLLGVGDDQAIVGLEHDYATLAHKDADGLTNHFGNMFNAMLGAHVRHLVTLRPFSIQNKECMLISIAPSSQPVYLDDEGREEFFVRTGNGTTSLKLSEAQAYIRARWGSTP